jgi:hypothetical protein
VKVVYKKVELTEQLCGCDSADRSVCCREGGDHDIDEEDHGMGEDNVVCFASVEHEAKGCVSRLLNFEDIPLSRHSVMYP